MANTKVSDLEPPLSFYKQTNIIPDIIWKLTVSADNKPGNVMYLLADDTVDHADSNVAAPAKNFYGIAGWIDGHPVDDVYAAAESVPILRKTPGMICPCKIANPGATFEPGQRMKLSATEGQLEVCTDDWTTEQSIGQLHERVNTGDTVAWIRFD